MNLVYTLTNDKENLSTKKIIINSFFEYFSPLFITWEKVERQRKILARHERTELKLKQSRNALNIIQETTCFNQSELIQFTYLMAEKHKELKDEIRKKQQDKEKIRNKAQSLIYFVNYDFHKIVFKNFEILHRYFKNRDETEPRICIKGNFKMHHKNKVITVFRDELVKYQSDADISENSGFDFIEKTGTYFLCNNIPLSLKNGQYKNPRINWKEVTKDKQRNTLEISEGWKKYWKDSSSHNDNKSFYKSTLIIPMTLWNNTLSEEFREKVNTNNIGRTIFGFLCIDHVKEDYFDEDYDVRVGYIFADILSQYIFNRSVYTDISKTFSEALQLLDSGFMENIDKEVITNIGKEIHKSRETPYVKQKEYDLEFKESNENTLFELDKNLIQYINHVLKKNLDVYTDSRN